jgi:hypothetical protein
LLLSLEKEVDKKESTVMNSKKKELKGMMVKAKIKMKEMKVMNNSNMKEIWKKNQAKKKMNL